MKDLMPAALRQELEDTITSLKAQVRRAMLAIQLTHQLGKTDKLS